MKKIKFFNAIEKGDLEEIRRALEAGMSPAVNNDQGTSALDVACFHGQDDIVELLLNPPAVKHLDLSLEIMPEQDNPICIVGYSSIFPGSGSTPAEFWKTLSGENHQMTEVPPERWSVDNYYSADRKEPGKMYTRRAGFIDRSPYEFDGDFFKIVPKEAEFMDPQQRLTLESAWFALEHAGINPLALKDKLVSVYCGIMTHDYVDMLIQGGVEHNNFIGTGNGASVLSGRVSYCFGFQGPCITVDTACSSSLVTTHLAIRSLQNDECDVALASGVNAMLAPGVTINCCKANMLAEDGVCKTFSEDADGYGRGEGVGMLVLKRYNDAIRDGNVIHGIIRGSAVNQDGASSGLTVPNKQAQVQVIRKALQVAGLSPDDIDFIEAHGTGTLLGDPIEIQALKEVFANRNPSILPVLIHSAKAFIGHLEAAAGVAGIIRVLESFKHKALTALPIHGNMNPKIHLEGTCLAVLQEKKAWHTKDGRVRRAGVSSFGFSGTNAHIILEEPPIETLSPQQRLVAQWTNEIDLDTPDRSTVDYDTQLLTLSAKDEKALGQMVRNYIYWLATPTTEQPSWLDLVFSSQTGRAHFPYRFTIQTDSIEGCLHQLRQYSPEQAVKKISEEAIHVFIPDLEQVDFSTFQNRYQEDVMFASLCRSIMKNVSSDVSIKVLECLAGPMEGLNDAHIQMTKLIAMYALYQRYQRMGVQPAQIISQGTGHFLASVLDGRLTLKDMLKIFEAYVLKNENGFLDTVDTVVTYDSDGYWELRSHQLCHDLYHGNLVDQSSESLLLITLGSSAQKTILSSLSALYCIGYDLNWHSLWQGSLRQFIQLPLYPFQRQSYQFKIKNVSNSAEHKELIPKWADGYKTVWETYAFPKPTLKSSIQSHLIIVTAGQWQNKLFIQAITKPLHSGANRLLWLTEGSIEQTEQCYTISFDQAENWQWLALKLRSQQVDRVIDLRYMDIDNERQALEHSLTDYFVSRLYQGQLCFQNWPEKEMTHGYITFFPTGKDVDESIQLCHSGLQGQLRSVGLKHRTMVSTLVENQDQSILMALSEIVSSPVDAVALSYEQGQWFKQILTRSLIDYESDDHQSSHNEEWIVITGGHGALGLTLARWYAEQGYKKIALLARREPTPENIEQLSQIQAISGGEVRSCVCDVVNLDNLTSVIQELNNDSKIAEVFHLAGRATIKSFEKMTYQDYLDSMKAKVIGALNLKNALMTLRYWPNQVVLFSSVASLLPEPGQAAYTASNRMLDCLSMLSQQGDKPMRVINWGLWGAVGVGADAEFVKLIRKGSGVLTESETQLWLKRFLASNETQLAVLSIDWSVYRKYLTQAEKTFVMPLLTEKSPEHQSSVQSSNIRQQLLSMRASERQEKIMNLIKQTVRDVSGKAMELLQAETTFEEELNLDSNLLAEIKDILQEKLGAEDEPLAATVLNDHESIQDLTEYLLTYVLSHSSASENVDTPTDYIRQLVQQDDVKVKIKSLNKVSNPQEPPLILMHTIMGSVFFYRALVERLNYSGQVLGIDNPYFSSLTIKFNSIEEMAFLYAKEIKQTFSGKSIRLAGLSFAGAVAYEVAQQLSGMGVRVDSVLMFDTAMPGAGDLALSPTQRQYVMGEIASDIDAYYQAEINNNQRILNAYRPTAPINQIRVILLKARSRDSVNRALPSLNDVCNGWLNLFCPEVYSVLGSHFSLFDRTYVDTTAQVMRYTYNMENYFVDKELQPNLDRNRELLLLQAARNGDSYLVLRLLKLNVNPMINDEDGNHPACFAAENDDLCSLAWIHYFAKERLNISSLYERATKGNALKTMSYLVENSEVSRPDEPDVALIMDTNKQQLTMMYGHSQSYQQREWMEILAAHNNSSHGAQQTSAMQILPPSKEALKEASVEKLGYDAMTVDKIACGRFSYEVVTKIKRGDSSKPNLFIFHAASGLALPYANLEDLAFGDVYGFSNPYFGNHEQRGFCSIEEMAAHYITRMKKVQPKGPYYLVGWSLGGIISQAMARMLEQGGETVGIVIMIDSINHYGKPYSRRSEEAAIEKILEGNTSLERYEGVSEAIKVCYHNTSEILQGYQAKIFSGRVVLLKADKHETTFIHDESDLVRWRQEMLADPFSGWGDLLPNFEIQSIAGDHNELFDRNCVSVVHSLLKAILATVEVGDSKNIALSQRWSMNLVKALRRNDVRIINLLMQQPSTDLSYHDAQGNLLDALVKSRKHDLLEKLDAQALMKLQTSTGSNASEIALEFGLTDLFNTLEQAYVSSVAISRSSQRFFVQSSPNSIFQDKAPGLQ